MRDEDLARIPTVDRFESELDVWQIKLTAVIQTISEAEITKAPECYTEARKTLAGVLQEMENARHFIAVKRNFLETFAPADVETLFLDDRSVTQIGVPEADHRSPGEDTSG